jgi:HEAT repeat protein
MKINNFILYFWILFVVEGFVGNTSVVLYGTKTKKMEFIKKVLNNKDKVYLKELGSLLEDEDKEVRTMASYTLYEIGDSTCVDYYKRALIDPHWQVRLYGVKGLVKLGEKDIIDSLVVALGDPYWQVRYYAAIGIGKYGNETCIGALVSRLNDGDLKVKEAILTSLKNLMWKNTARSYFKSMGEGELKNVFDCFNLDSELDENIRIKILTISLFESANDIRCIPYLVNLLGDKSDEVKIKALWLLEKFKAIDVSEIGGLLNEPSIKLKIEGIKTIARLKQQEGMEGLIKALEDENEMVRIYSLWGLEKLKNPGSYHDIVKCLADKSINVRNETINLIERLKDPLFIPALIKFSEDKNVNAEYRKTAIVELGKVVRENIGLEKIEKEDLEMVKEKLRNYLKDENKEIRYGTIEGFYYVDKFDDYYIRSLVYMEKNDSDERVRKASSRYLGEIIEEAILKLESSKKEERYFVMDKVENFVGSKTINKLLLKMFYSKYPEIKEKALVILKDSPDRIFSKNVKELIKTPDLEIKKLCAIILGEIKDKNSINILKQGLNHFDPEYQLICAWALAKMGNKDGLNIILKSIDNENINFQRLAIEGLIFLNDKYYSSYLIKKLFDSELEIKLLAAYGLARMGEDIGLEILVRLSEANVEPIRTNANIYLKDQQIPLSLRNKISLLREEMYKSKIGVQELKQKVLYSFKTEIPLEIDGRDNEKIWTMIEKASGFVTVVDEKLFSGIQTKIGSCYDNENIYFLFICENPPESVINYDTRDFITISIIPQNLSKEWYQFVFHPLMHIKYSYLWTFYKEYKREKLWESNWKVKTDISVPDKRGKWIAEVLIPIKDLKIEKIKNDMVFRVNFQREIQDYITSTWTGRIDIPDQFGLLIFKENL